MTGRSLSAAEQWVRRLKPAFRGETGIGFMVVFAERDPVTEAPLWALGFDTDQDAAYERAVATMVNQLPWETRSIEIWAP